MNIVQFLESSGLVRGEIPPENFTCGGIRCVKDPVDAIRLGIREDHPASSSAFLAGCRVEKIVACISIGAHPKECSVCVPDMLLGVLTPQKTWRWAGTENGHVVNLHGGGGLEVCDGWPVWLTYTRCDGPRRRLIRSKIQEIDVYKDVLARRRTEFWNASYEEFIRKTWHPSRLAWCMDTDEYREIFSGVDVNGEL
jgi:hypothetical protein